MNKQIRPALTKKISLDDFKNFYWLKSELITFCRAYHIPVSGAKHNLIERICEFLSTGKIADKISSPNKTKIRDSEKTITRNTIVSHYKNDAATRSFFISQIGKDFRFNAYLRQFVNHRQNNLTYGDLVDGWLEAEAKRKTSQPIDRQFEYNQFIRDFFANEKDKTLQDAINAWKSVKMISGPNTYSHYKLVF